MVLIAASNTALQTLSDNEMRGRVMSIFSMMIVGMAPFGSLLMGWAADQVGAPLVVAIGGGFCALSGLVFARRERHEFQRNIRLSMKQRGLRNPRTNGNFQLA